MEDLPPRKTPYEHMLDLMPDATEAQRRTRLGTLGFAAHLADTRAENLSGGEKARLLFALATFHGPHLLVLDEPTNHLDVDAREALVRALNDYEGAVILISHDRHLIDACVDRLWLVRNGTVRAYNRDLDAYRAECLAERTAGDATPGRPKARKDRSPQLNVRQHAAQRRATLAPLKKEVTKAQLEIDRITAKIAAIDESLLEAALYVREPARAQALARERGGLERALEDAEGAWLAASETYERAQLRLETTGPAPEASQGADE
jgi:ATP-binding cassette subfamily F protein 3